MTTAQALADLQRMVAWTKDPVLSSDDMARLLEIAKIVDAYGNPPDAYTEWTASTAVSSAQTRVPVRRNGFVYRVSSPGTTGATEPIWPTTIGATVADGTAAWECYAAAPWRWTWDLASAASTGWTWKAAAAAQDVTFQADGSYIFASDLIKNCQRMADLYGKQALGSVGSVTIAAPMTLPRSWTE